jgi:oligopeptide/dipeptide ABC transporter ATP-binding protein
VSAETTTSTRPRAGVEPVLRVADLHVRYAARRRKTKPVVAVDSVSFDVMPGEVLALVGESGCGKTSIARAVMRLVKPTAGSIVFRGRDITGLSSRALRSIRAGVQMVFQDPYESLDPRQTVFDLVAEPLAIHRRGRDRAHRRRAVLAALEDAGLRPAEEIARRYPHHLSGGQRQRVAIAAAMVLEPDLIVADEPVSMLDVSLRAGILRLMLELRARRDVSYLFITHDLSLAWVVADRIAVVYLGRIVELGPSAEVIARPRHPYTRALVSVIPVPEAGAAAEQIVLVGETPSARNVPPGCRFHPRCWRYEALGRPGDCVTRDPRLEPQAARPEAEAADDRGRADGPGAPHQAACHFPLDETGDVAARTLRASDPGGAR